MKVNIDMDKEQQYTVEHQDRYGITYYDQVMACSVGDARGKVQSSYPDASIRAITLSPISDSGSNGLDTQPLVYPHE